MGKMPTKTRRSATQSRIKSINLGTVQVNNARLTNMAVMNYKPTPKTKGLNSNLEPYNIFNKLVFLLTSATFSSDVKHTIT